MPLFEKKEDNSQIEKLLKTNVDNLEKKIYEIQKILGLDHSNNKKISWENDTVIARLFSESKVREPIALLMSKNKSASMLAKNAENTLAEVKAKAERARDTNDITVARWPKVLESKKEAAVAKAAEAMEAKVALVKGLVERFKTMKDLEANAMKDAEAMNVEYMDKEWMMKVIENIYGKEQVPEWKEVVEVWERRREEGTSGSGAGGKKRKSKKVRKSRMGRFPHKRKSKKVRKSKKR